MTDRPQVADAARSRYRWVRWPIMVVCLVLVAMWVYVLFFAPKTGAYRVRDQAWRDKAQEICKEANTRRVALANTTGGYIEHPTREQMIERADIVDKSTDILEQMLNDLAAIPVTSENDQLRIDTFEKYYRIILSDRRDYTATLRRFELRPYKETTIDKGGPVTDVVTDFTSGNNIKACVPPGELGGDTTGTPSN